MYIWKNYIKALNIVLSVKNGKTISSVDCVFVLQKEKKKYILTL